MRVGTRIRQFRVDGSVHVGIVASSGWNEGGTRYWIGIVFDGADVEAPENVGWFEPRDLKGAGIVAPFACSGRAA